MYGYVCSLAYRSSFRFHHFCSCFLNTSRDRFELFLGKMNFRISLRYDWDNRNTSMTTNNWYICIRYIQIL